MDMDMDINSDEEEKNEVINLEYDVVEEPNSSEQGLAEAFDIELTKKGIDESSVKIKRITTDLSEQKYKLEDKQYIQEELKMLIESNKNVLYTLGNQCKMGASPRMYEVYSTLSNSITNNLMDLAKLNQLVTDYQVTEDNLVQKEKSNRTKQEMIRMSRQNTQSESTLIQNNTYNFTSNDMLNMLSKIDIEKKITNTDELPEFNLD
jgi:hypothetical protein